MGSFYRQSHFGTAIEICVKGHILNPKSDDLAVSKGNLLEIYSLVFQHSAHPFFALIQSMSCIKFAGHARHSLLMGFQNALVSIVTYNPMTNSLITIAMFNFDRHYITEGFTKQSYRYLSVTDPLDRCALMTVSETKVLVLPLKQNNLTFLKNQNKLVAHRDLEPEEKKNIFNVKEKSLYLIDLKGINVNEIKDMKFLHGYDQPSVLVLHSSERTWMGRNAINEFACELVAISLNLQQKSYSVFKRIDSLPQDCQSICTTRSIIGGAIVFSPSLIMHVTKGIDYAIGLNDLAKVSKNYEVDPVASQEILNFDDCKHKQLNESTLLITTKDGDCFLLNFFLKRLRLTRSSFVLDTLPSLLIGLDAHKLLFVQSYCGDSLLVRYTETVLLDQKGNENRIEDRNENKRLRSNDQEKTSSVPIELLNNGDSFSHTMRATKIFGQQTADEISLLFSEESEKPLAPSIKKSSFEFEVVDALLNYSPLIDFEKRISRDLSSFELVTISGMGKTGALNIMYNGVKLKSKESVAILSSEGEEIKWAGKIRLTVIEKRGNDFETLEKEGDKVELVMISCKSKTKIFKRNASEFVEDNSLILKEEIILTANLNEKTFINITESSLKIFSSENNFVVLISNIESGKKLRKAEMREPFVFLLYCDGSVGLAKILADYKIELVGLDLIDKERAGEVTAFTVYKEDNMLRQFGEQRAVKTNSKKDFVKNAETGDVQEPNVKEESELLDLFYEIDEEDVSIIDTKFNIKQEVCVENNRNSPVYFVSLTRKNGRLEMYSLPEFKRLYIFFNFSSGFQFCRNHLCVREMEEFFSERHVVDIRMTPIGTNNRLFLLAIMSDGKMLIYETYHHDQNKSLESKEYFPLRLSRVKHGIIQPLFDSTIEKRFSRHFFEFESLCKGPGLFIAGDQPYWMFFKRGNIKLFPLKPKIAVKFFVELENQTFLLVDINNNVLKASISNFINFECDIPFRRIPLKSSVAKIIYHSLTSSYVVTSFYSKEIFPLEYPTKRALKVTQSQYSFKVFDHRTMKLMGSYEAFEEHEYIVSIHPTDLELQKRGHSPKICSLMAIGTGIQKGEEVACRGKLYIFSLENKEKSVLITKLFEQKQFGPITAFATVSGLLAACIGPKILLFYWNGNSLVGCAFYDLHFYSITCVSLKNFIIVGDAYRCFYLLLWEPGSRQLLMLSKNDSFFQITSSQFLINDSQVSFFSADANKNIHLYQYDPKNPANRGGKKLQQTANFHSGHFIVKSVLLKASSEEKKYFIFAGTADGAFVEVVPVNKKTFNKLQSLSALMTYYLEHNGGTNPRLFRKPSFINQTNQQNFFVDGDVVWQYAELDIYKQIDLAKKIKCSREEILNKLEHIDATTRFS